jgi:hypothetical protein
MDAGAEGHYSSLLPLLLLLLQRMGMGRVGGRRKRRDRLGGGRRAGWVAGGALAEEVAPG